MSARQAEIETFLRAAGWADGVRSPLAGDASARRYERIISGARRAVLMDAPCEPGQVRQAPTGHIEPTGYSAQARLAVDCRPFYALARFLHGLGLSAPAIYAHDLALGLLLLEDLGDDLYVRLLEAAAPAPRAAALYSSAVDVLLALHEVKSPEALLLPGGGTYTPCHYDRGVYQVEADLLIDWYLPALTGKPLEAAAREAYRAAWREALTAVEPSAPVLCLRDYHAGNLIWLSARDGIGRVGLLDFQDGLLGHPAYDLVSLLQDARRDVEPEIEARMLDRYIAAARARSGFDEARFRAAYAILGAQRNAKIVGIFTRLSRRDGKPQYLPHLPRVWRYLETDLQTPALMPVRQWLQAYVPPDQRKLAPTSTMTGFAPARRAAS